MVFLNKKTGETRIKVFPLECGMWGRDKVKNTILHLVYHDRSYKRILESTDWKEYEVLKADLEAEKRKITI